MTKYIDLTSLNGLNRMTHRIFSALMNENILRYLFESCQIICILCQLFGALSSINSFKNSWLKTVDPRVHNDPLSEQTVFVSCNWENDIHYLSSLIASVMSNSGSKDVSIECPLSMYDQTVNNWHNLTFWTIAI